MKQSLLIGAECPLPKQGEICETLGQAAQKLRQVRQGLGQPKGKTSGKIKENSPVPYYLSDGDGKNYESGGNQSGDEGGSLFSQNFNTSLNHYRGSDGGSRGTGSGYGHRSVRSIDSGNVTQNLRKIDRLEADVACKHKRVPIQDEEGNLIQVKVKSEKMSRMQTFFAMLKCYCAINVLLTPKSFANGGFLLSPIVLVIACIF